MESPTEAGSPMALPSLPLSKPNAMKMSCELCKRRKIKCDRQGDRCTACISRSVECIIHAPKKKETLSKRRDYLTSMEGRIKAMESVIDASGLRRGRLRDEDDNMPNMLERQAELSDQLSILVIKEKGVSNFIGPSSGLSLFSPHGLRWISERIERDSFRRLMSIMSEAELLNHSDVRTDLWAPMAAYEREPLPARPLADAYVACYFATFNGVFPLYQETVFREHYERQYSGIPPAGAPWYASLNVVLAMGSVILRSRNREPVLGSAVDHADPSRDISWRYFRNASSTFLDLQFKEYNLMSIQAILGMAFMMQATSDPHPPYVLAAAAARLAYALGLHRRLSEDFGLTAAQRQERHNVFWIMYMLDKAINLRSGRSSVVNDEDIGIGLPTAAATLVADAVSFDTFRAMAILALLESRVYSKLYSARSRTRSRAERLAAVGQLDDELQRWRDTMPVEIRPEHAIRCRQDAYMPVLMMHFAYFNCLTAIHRMSVHAGAWTAEPGPAGRAAEERQAQANPRVYASGSICLSAARKVIELVRSLKREEGTPLDNLMWMAFQYPLSASLALFAHVLQQPGDGQAAADVELMAVVTSTLARLSAAGRCTTPAGTLKIFEELRLIAADVVARASVEPAKRLRRRRDDEAEAEAEAEAEPTGRQRASLDVRQLTELAFFDSVDPRLADLDQELQGVAQTADPLAGLGAQAQAPGQAQAQAQAMEVKEDLAIPSPADPLFSPMLFQWDASELWPARGDDGQALPDLSTPDGSAGGQA